jgi:hypothetical protein
LSALALVRPSAVEARTAGSFWITRVTHAAAPPQASAFSRAVASQARLT